MVVADTVFTYGAAATSGAKVDEGTVGLLGRNGALSESAKKAGFFDVEKRSVMPLAVTPADWISRVGLALLAVSRFKDGWLDVVAILVVVLMGAGRVNVGLVYFDSSSAPAVPAVDSILRGVDIACWLCEISGDSFESIDGFDPSEFCRFSACPLIV